MDAHSFDSKIMSGGKTVMRGVAHKAPVRERTADTCGERAHACVCTRARHVCDGMSCSGDSGSSGGSGGSGSSVGSGGSVGVGV